MNYQFAFSTLCEEVRSMENPGKVATYIPELAHVDPHKFGVYLRSLDNQAAGFGDCTEKFSIQSIAKVLSLSMAYQILGEALWKRVGVEPSGDPFNSLVQLEFEKGIPRNPLINAGAIVICDVLMSELETPQDNFLAFIRRLSGIPDLSYSLHIAESEKATGYRNASLVNLMKSFGNIHNEVEEVLDLYFKLCSIELSCEELSQTFLFLANGGINPLNGERVITRSKTKRINAIMQLCGFYDEAGEFSFRVGIPGKSGVGGGIAAVLPDVYSIVVWSPPLNEKGNSYKGVKFLERFTSLTESSIF
ncbi:MAG: glutaminase [Bacteroidota bacterium]